MKVGDKVIVIRECVQVAVGRKGTIVQENEHTFEIETFSGARFLIGKERVEPMPKHRIIKYAAKRLEDGHWVYGYVTKRHGRFWIENEMYVDDRMKHCLWGIKEDTLCQYTGIDGACDIEIYEGDKVWSYGLIPGVENFNGVVKFLEGGWVIDNGEDAVPLWREGTKLITDGNIHNG